MLRQAAHPALQPAQLQERAQHPALPKRQAAHLPDQMRPKRPADRLRERLKPVPLPHLLHPKRPVKQRGRFNFFPGGGGNGRLPDNAATGEAEGVTVYEATYTIQLNQAALNAAGKREEQQ